MPAVNLLLCVVSCRLPHSSWTWTPWECHSLHEDGSVQMMTLQPPTAMPTSHPLPEMDSLASSLSKLLFLSIRYGREEVHRTAHSSWKLCSWTQVFDALKNPPYMSLCSGCYSCRSGLWKRHHHSESVPKPGAYGQICQHVYRLLPPAFRVSSRNSEHLRKC